MELKLWDYYKRELNTVAIAIVSVVLLGILKFFHWSTVETIMGMAGTFWDWFLRIVFGLSAVIAAIVLGTLLISPYRMYLEHRTAVRYAAMMTHWEGALAKAMRDLGKSLKDYNEIGIEKSAKILLKEIQIQCTFGRSILEMQTKLEGLCEGILVDRPAGFAEKIELRLIVRKEDLYEFLQLKVGGRTYTRSMRQIA